MGAFMQGEGRAVSLYVHVPFCRKKCDYCDFFSMGQNTCAHFDTLKADYVSAVYVYNEDGSKKMEPKVFRYTLTDDLDLIDELTARDDLFCLMSPISYAGKSRSAENARFMYAMAFDLDNIRVKEDGTPIGLMNLWNGHIETAERLPKPTYIVSSGNGLHLYYVFEKPVPLFTNIVKQLEKLKYELTWMMWNEGIVNIKSEKDIQQEGIYQGFRVPGTITKHEDGSRARAFRTGEKVDIDYLNGFVAEESRDGVRL